MASPACVNILLFESHYIEFSRSKPNYMHKVDFDNYVNFKEICQQITAVEVPLFSFLGFNYAFISYRQVKKPQAYIYGHFILTLCCLVQKFYLVISLF